MKRFKMMLLAVPFALAIGVLMVACSSKASGLGDPVITPINKPTYETKTVGYTGLTQMFDWNNWLSGYSSARMELGGTTSAKDAGDYTVTVTPKEGFEWRDGGTVSFVWTITPSNVTVTNVAVVGTVNAGMSLASLQFTGNAMANGHTVAGTFRFKSNQDITIGTPKAYIVEFFPTDWQNYNVATTSVSFVIGKGTHSAAVFALDPITWDYTSGMQLKEITLPLYYRWRFPESEIAPDKDGKYVAHAIFNIDSNFYNDLIIDVTINLVS